MRFKQKGRKIYKTKEKNYYGKSPFGKFMSAALTVILIGGIGFIGYSVAEPLLNYSQHKGDTPEEEATAGTEAQDASGEPSAVSDHDGSGETVGSGSGNYVAMALKTSDLLNAQSLQAALDAVPRDMGINYIEVPLKSKGGYLWYGSGIYDAQAMGAVQAYMPLSEIVSLVESSGFGTAAVISTLEDSRMPSVYYDAGYITVADGAQWIDNDLDAGGKPWMSPYSQRAMDYLSEIAVEISSAGFDRVICSGLVFPYFRQSDLEHLGEKYGRTERCMALTSAANLLYEKIMSCGSMMQVEISAGEILSGRGDVLQPSLLSAKNIILKVDLDELSGGITDGTNSYDFTGTPSDIAIKCATLTADRLSDFNVSIRLTGSSLTMEQLREARQKISEYGYSSFVIG